MHLCAYCQSAKDYYELASDVPTALSTLAVVQRWREVSEASAPRQLVLDFVEGAGQLR